MEGPRQWRVILTKILLKWQGWGGLSPLPLPIGSMNLVIQGGHSQVFSIDRD